MKKEAKKRNVLLVLGEPGTGKTTQCKEIAKRFDLEYFSIYDLLHLNEFAPNKIEKLKAYAELNIKDISLLFSNMISTTQNTILREGFPSTNIEYSIWNKAINKAINIVGALYFHCPEEIMKYRLFNRKENLIDDI